MSISGCDIVLYLHDITTGGNWVKGTRDSFVLCLQLHETPTVILK